MLPSIFKYTYLLVHEEDAIPQFVLIHDMLSCQLVGVIEHRGRRSWGVQDHLYIKFKTWEDAAWALRDYHIAQHRYYALTCQLQENDGHLTMVKKMKHPRGAFAIYKRGIIKLHRDLLAALLSYSSRS